MLRHQLDFTGCQIHIRRGSGPRAYPSPHADHELVAQPLGFLEHLGRFRIEYDLHQPFAIAQIHENDAAMIAPAVYPARDRDLLPDQSLIDAAAIMGPHDWMLASPQACGTTTPQVMIIFIAASTLMPSSIASSLATMTMYPDVGFGAVGT